MTKFHAGPMTHTVVGFTQFFETTTIFPHTPVQVRKVQPGDIVYSPGSWGIAPQWYRVYDDGQSLRFWCVTAQFAEAVATMQAECEKLASAKYDGLDEPQGNNGEPLITSEWQYGDDWRAEWAEYDEYMYSHPNNGWGL